MLFDKMGVLKKKNDEFLSLVKRVVYSVNTIKQLKEVAPELSRYIPDDGVPGTALIDPATVLALRSILNN